MAAGRLQTALMDHVPQLGPDSGRHAASRGMEGCHRFLSDPVNAPEIACALRIRDVENSLYDLFGKGKLHGTIHTCIGQEFSGAILGKYLREGDFVTSNHRCHGHFIGATGDWRGLIDELVGTKMESVPE
jgi:Dehydrogenase E1 component